MFGKEHFLCLLHFHVTHRYIEKIVKHIRFLIRLLLTHIDILILIEFTHYLVYSCSSLFDGQFKNGLLYAGAESIYSQQSNFIDGNSAKITRNIFFRKQYSLLKYCWKHDSTCQINIFLTYVLINIVNSETKTVQQRLKKVYAIINIYLTNCSSTRIFTENYYHYMEFCEISRRSLHFNIVKQTRYLQIGLETW